MARCRACNSRVEDGAVRCQSCGAELSSKSSFVAVIGWVMVAISSVPIGLGVVLEGEHDHIGLIVGGVLLAGGLALVTGAAVASRGKEPPVITDEDSSAIPHP